MLSTPDINQSSPVAALTIPPQQVEADLNSLPKGNPAQPALRDGTPAARFLLLHQKAQSPLRAAQASDRLDHAGTRTTLLEKALQRVEAYAHWGINE